ncbi:GntR family transcriptional regulator [Intestinibacter sp.]|uniref:GntR family transcriptional regulator n=1 Tax=Intestinibacter sp. TaxID=1965304 RepID=UPI003F15B629
MGAKYQQIVEDIEKDIVNGKYDATKKLPTEEELVAKYEVSRTTIRKAIGILSRKGYIYQVQGSGMFVREAILKGYVSLETLRGLTRDFPDRDISSKVVSIEVLEAEEALARKMKCAIGTNVYYVKRLRIVDGNTFSMEYSYYNKDIIPYLNEDIAKASIYTYITEDLKLNIGFADKVIYADKMDEESCKLLGLEMSDPALVIENTAFLNNGDVFEVSKAVHNYKYAKLLKLATF